ncbi:uridylate-specific endoribonuclease-like [Mya arenaria]|uniref:uridylate-specific endoribonuclease-like n=1 Tax=Mya arenaria TaxID=6604 RepID=UPI0022E220FF|nr:uridylate-specific endoribonuclease-like [Mya arenaria]
MAWCVSTSLIILVAVFSAYVTAQDSCAGRCGDVLNNAFSCQCNSQCTTYGDCCTDFSVFCLEANCQGRCDQSADMNMPCQCNPSCTTYNDCCSDYQSTCVNGGGGGTGPAPGDHLSAIIDDIWASDTNRMNVGSDIVIDLNGNTKLFSSVNEAYFTRPTYAAFINLLDNYVRTIGQAESQSAAETTEITAFVDLLLATEAVDLAKNYLISQGKVTNANFRSIFSELWFNFYGRSSGSSVQDSSGFEHVMVGEIKGSAVSGFHSWIQFYLQEKANNLDYTSMVTQTEPNVKGAAFLWYGASKGKGSFFLGTSPEFDLSVYTVCALMYPDSRCNFVLQGTSLSIQTWDIAHKAGYQIGSAYPAI